MSLADPDARPIRKGKLGKPNEFGYVAQIAEVTEHTRRGRQRADPPRAEQDREPWRGHAAARHDRRTRSARDPAEARSRWTAGSTSARPARHSKITTSIPTGCSSPAVNNQAPNAPNDECSATEPAPKDGSVTSNAATAWTDPPERRRRPADLDRMEHPGLPRCLAQPRQQLTHRGPAVADPVLLDVGELGHRPARALRVGQKGGVIAKPALAPRLGGQRPGAVRRGTTRSSSRRGIDVDQRADIAQRAAGRRARAQQVEVLLIGGVLAGESRRPHAGRAVQRRGLDPRVVGDRGTTGRLRRRRAPWAARCPRTCRRPQAAARRRRAAARPTSPPAPAAVRTPAACAGFGSRAAARRPPAPVSPPLAATACSCSGLQRRDPVGGQRQQVVQMRAGERRALGRRLHLDEPAVAGHHDVRVDLGGRVLGVVEIEQRRAADDSRRDGRDGAGQRRPLELRRRRSAWRRRAAARPSRR